MKVFLKKYLVAGALVVVPIAGTFWVLKTLVLWMDDFVRSFIPVPLDPVTWLGKDIPGLGLLLTIPLLLLVGVLTRVYLGKRLIAWGDQLLHNIPFGSSVYSLIKQVTNTLVSRDKTSFREVVLVEFPRRGSFAIGFITNESPIAVQQKVGFPLVNVFVPTTPNPTSGYLFMISRDQLTPLNISSEEAFKLVISGGIVKSPGSEHGN